MTGRAWMCSLVLLAATAAHAQQPPPQRDMRALPIFYSVPGTERVRVQQDVVFRRAGGQDLKADIYMPERPGRYPVVLLVSGGSVNDWRIARFYTDAGRLLAAQGFVGVSYDKRASRQPESALTAAEDTLAAIEHVKQNAARYQADPDRVCT